MKLSGLQRNHQLLIDDFFIIFNLKSQSSMVLPDDQANTAKYIAVIIAQVAATLLIYLILRVIHFLVWGHLYLQSNKDIEAKQQADVDERRWDQEGWDVSFPVLYANHVIAIALPILYFPSVFICVVAFIHFTLFLALIIVNVFIKDLDPGNGARTNVSRIIWGLMCIVNMILLISGVSLVNKIIA